MCNNNDIFIFESTGIIYSPEYIALRALIEAGYIMESDEMLLFDDEASSFRKFWRYFTKGLASNHCRLVQGEDNDR